MKQTDLAYIAGIVDGEGCLTKTIPGKSKWGLSYKIAVGSTDFELLEWLLKTIKLGGIYVNSSSLNNSKWKKSWVWILQDRRSVSFLLKLILPYLRTYRKIEKAKTFIKEIDSLGTSYLPWNKKEDKILQDNFLQYSDEELMTIFPGRTKVGIKKRRWKLKLLRHKKKKV